MQSWLWNQFRLSFHDLITSVRLEGTFKSLNLAGRPANFEAIDKFGCTKTNQESRIVGREITASAFAMTHELAAGDIERNLGANGVTIAALRIAMTGAFQVQADPMMWSGSFVVQQVDRFTVVGDCNVHSPVVVEITNGQAPTHMRFLEIPTGSG
jgi:hypothetical protein